MGEILRALELRSGSPRTYPISCTCEWTEHDRQQPTDLER